MVMKRFIISASLLALSIPSLRAQDPEGPLCYSLPQTVINLEVEAVKETFHAGPYAKYAKKYLGIETRQADEVSNTIGAVRLEAVVEADLSARHTINPGKGLPAFLSLTAQGLVASGDGFTSKAGEWTFPGESHGDFSGKGIISNLTSESATLRRGGSSSGKPREVRQEMVVAKSTEDKAREAANMIINLQKVRVQIVTGDTDANYSGEAMKSALEEISRLEADYLSLFTGYSEYSTQKVNFSVIPVKGHSDKYIAFRLSDSEGLLSADNVGGKPYILEISAPKTEAAAGAPVSSSKIQLAHYRIPAICSVRLSDGGSGRGAILQTRIPVYQLGIDSTFPISNK